VSLDFGGEDANGANELAASLPRDGFVVGIVRRKLIGSTVGVARIESKKAA
jgi:hypothetical protein